MNNQIKCLVLSQMDYKEHDSLVRVFSAEFGLMSFHIRGVRKANSKLSAFAMPFTMVNYYYKESEPSRLHRLIQADLVEAYTKLHSSLEKMSLAEWVGELFDPWLKQIEDAQECTALFRELEFIFSVLNKTDRLRHFIAYVFMVYFRWEGIEPVLDGCVHCGKTEVSRFSIEEGGFICRDCIHMSQGSEISSLDVLKMMRALAFVNQENYSRFEAFDEPSQQVIQLLHDYYRYHVGHTLKSWQFMHKWSII